jgi:hypothetical protein
MPPWFSDYYWGASFTVEAQSLLQAHITTAHVACGSLILAIAVIIAVRSLRLLQAAPRTSVLAGKLTGVAA